MSGRFQYLSLAEAFGVPPRGGHVVWLHEVSRRLSGVRLLTGRWAGEPDYAVVDGVEIVRIGLKRWPLVRPESLPLYATYLAQAVRQVLSGRPKAILAARVLPEGLLAGILSRALGVPSAVFAHGEEVHRMRPDRVLGGRRRVTAALKRKALWAAYRHVDLIIANSRFTAKLLRRGGVDERRVSVVHPGTDPSCFQPMPRDPCLAAKLGVEGKAVVLSVGRLVHRKGQDTVIRAMPAILRQAPNAVYVVAGKGYYEEQLRRLAESVGVSDHLRFIGEVDNETLPKLYNLANAFVMPNRVTAELGDLEGFGIVFLEAGACGVPVVGGRSGGVPDAIVDGQTGLLVDGSSVAEVAGAVVRLLMDPDGACRMGQNARRRICRELTWDHSAEKIRRLLESLRRPSRFAANALPSDACVKE